MLTGTVLSDEAGPELLLANAILEPEPAEEPKAEVVKSVELGKYVSGEFCSMLVDERGPLLPEEMLDDVPSWFLSETVLPDSLTLLEFRGELSVLDGGSWVVVGGDSGGMVDWGDSLPMV